MYTVKMAKEKVEEEICHIRERFNRCHRSFARGCQFSGGRSKVESRNPRKIGTVVPNILVLLERGVPKLGVPIFL